jgi:hypothetical protein
MAQQAIHPLAQRLTRPRGDDQGEDQQGQAQIEKPALADPVGDQRQRRSDEYQGQLQAKVDQSPPLPRLDSRKLRTPSR